MPTDRLRSEIEIILINKHPCAGSGPFSTARWNPFGRFLVLAGIGNLPGDLHFFDKKADGKCRPMGTPTR